eukprot:1159946-Pelagomonas_calceolata.AAC.5
MMKIGGPQITLLASDHPNKALSSNLGLLFYSKMCVCDLHIHYQHLALQHLPKQEKKEDSGLPKTAQFGVAGGQEWRLGGQQFGKRSLCLLELLRAFAFTPLLVPVGATGQLWASRMPGIALAWLWSTQGSSSTCNIKQFTEDDLEACSYLRRRMNSSADRGSADEGGGGQRLDCFSSFRLAGEPS